MRTVVVGGGPAGLISAYFSAINGSEVILFEKNEKLGISGITGKTDGKTIRLNIGISKLLLNLENWYLHPKFSPYENQVIPFE